MLALNINTVLTINKMQAEAASLMRFLSPMRLEVPPGIGNRRSETPGCQPVCCGKVSRFWLKQFIHELVLVEIGEVTRLLARTHEPRRQPQFVLDGDGDAAFSGSVKFGDDQTR